MPKKIENEPKDQGKKTVIYGNPEYPSSDDIFNHRNQVELNDSTDGQIGKISKDKKRTGEELDVPGSELDDSDEKIGEEDEENNYYSLGGDDHNDLEEDKEE